MEAAVSVPRFFDVVLVDDSSRPSRSLSDAILLRATCHRSSVSFRKSGLVSQTVGFQCFERYRSRVQQPACRTSAANRVTLPVCFAGLLLLRPEPSSRLHINEGSSHPIFPSGQRRRTTSVDRLA